MNNPVSSKRVFTTKRLVTDALFAALYVVFSCFVTLKMPTMEISFSSLPVILCALLLGPLDAVVIAFIGSFIEQLLFGLSLTAPLWMLPPILQGAVVGLLARVFFSKKNYTGAKALKAALLIGIICFGELLLTATNTAALYLDGAIVGYPVKALNLILVPRLLNCSVRMICTCIIVFLLLPPVQKIFSMRKNS